MYSTTQTSSWLQLVSRRPAQNGAAHVRWAVLATCAYFDVHDMAMTGWEVYRWLWQGDLNQRPALIAVYAALRQLTDEGVLEYHEGMYCYRGRARIIATRKRRQAVAARKWRKARRMAALVAMMPYVRLVAVSNSLAWDNVHVDSDLDFFLVAEGGHMWTARGWATLALALLRRRPRLGHTRDTVCLNFWTVPGTPLRRVRLTEDIYFSYWLASLRPLYDAGGVRRRLSEANRWLDLSVPVPYGCHPRSDHAARLPRGCAWVKRALEALQRFGWQERAFERLQRAVMPRVIRHKEIEPSTHVLLGRDMLKFHTNDRRAEIRDQWQKRMRQARR